MPAGPIGSSWVADSWTDVSWEADSWADAAVGLLFILDMNTRCQVYLCDLYSLDATTDLTPMVRRYLDSKTGEMTARVLQLIQDATDEMT